MHEGNNTGSQEAKERDHGWILPRAVEEESVSRPYHQPNPVRTCMVMSFMHPVQHMCPAQIYGAFMCRGYLHDSLTFMCHRHIFAARMASLCVVGTYSAR